MPFVSGGILAEWGPPKAALHVVQQEIRDFSPKSHDEQYVIDFAFLTWHNFREPDEPYGVNPGPVGRTQKRFIVGHSVPQGLETPRDVRRWLVSVLPDTEQVVRNYLPTKSRAYPATELADEVAALRVHLSARLD